MTHQNHSENIELRSPRLRSLVNSIPRGLLLWAVLVPCLILATLVLVMVLVTYPGREESLMHHLLF